MTLITAMLWLCTYLNNDTPPRVFSVAYADMNWAQGEAHDTCWRYCLKHDCECAFKDCRPWSPNGR